MWFFKKKVEPPPPPPPNIPPTHFSTTSLQMGDDCVCIDDKPHTQTHQKLLVVGQVYTVRTIELGNEDGYGGPFIRVYGIFPIKDSSWACARFEKVIKPKTESSILEEVMKPAGLDVEREKELAKEIYQ